MRWPENNSSNFIFWLLPLVFVSLINQACHPSYKTEELKVNSSENILGGVPVNEQDSFAQHIVGLEISASIFCTGVLISKNIVLTAAHCTGASVDPRLVTIVFGMDLTKNLERRKVLGGVTTEKWPTLTEEVISQPKESWNDLALLKFEGEAPSGYQPVRILSNFSKAISGTDILISGYGLTSMPETQTLNLMKAVVKLTDPLFNNTEFLLAHYEGKGACHGDSGGPALVRIKDKKGQQNWFLAGIASRAASTLGSETCSEGTIYTKVSAHLKFLNESIKFLNSDKFVPGEPIPQPEI